MAEPIGITSGVLALAGFAWKSSLVLYQTVHSFQSSKRAVRELKEELGALTVVLESLKDLSEDSDTAFIVLKIPLYRCGNACEEFKALVDKSAPHSDQARKSFRDWARLKYKGDDIDEFKRMLAAYKSTINIAIGDINL
jgi:Fungal N-terminal domain of STAND proteins